jgi:hypothetical protein
MRVASIEIPVSKEPLYQALSAFLGVLAYPDDDERAMRFSNAYCRETILASAKENRDFAWAPQLIRPVYFLTEAKAAHAELRAGAKALAGRKTAVINT